MKVYVVVGKRPALLVYLNKLSDPTQFYFSRLKNSCY